MDALLPHLRSTNLLLIGPDAATREVLAQLVTSLAPPVAWFDGATSEFPNGPIGSLIIRDVAGLTRVRQQHLLERMQNGSWSARVIATSASPAFPHVDRGVFSASLYYRINMITLRLDRQPDGQSRPISAIGRITDAGAGSLSRDDELSVPSPHLRRRAVGPSRSGERASVKES